jgi:hypothetical protein
LEDYTRYLWDSYGMMMQSEDYMGEYGRFCGKILQSSWWNYGRIVVKPGASTNDLHGSESMIP